MGHFGSPLMDLLVFNIANNRVIFPWLCTATSDDSQVCGFRFIQHMTKNTKIEAKINFSPKGK